MVRGLYFVELGEALPPSAQIRIASKPGITPSNPAVLQFARMYDRCTDCRNKAIGEAFSYVVCFYPEFSVWMLLYGHFSWMATIGSRRVTPQTNEQG